MIDDRLTNQFLTFTLLINNLNKQIFYIDNLHFLHQLLKLRKKFIVIFGFLGIELHHVLSSPGETVFNFPGHHLIIGFAELLVNLLVGIVALLSTVDLCATGNAPVPLPSTLSAKIAEFAFLYLLSFGPFLLHV